MKAISLSLSLAKQISLVFEQLEPELIGLTGGTIIMRIRNDVIGKFGVKHDALESYDGELKPVRQGMSKRHVASFLKTAVEALKYKKHWTHGEIVFDFAIKRGELQVSTWFESNYNMIHILEKEEGQPRVYKHVS